MKRLFIIFMSLLLAFSLFSCATPESDTASERGGKTYVWEKEGFGGNFTITLNADGTYQYYVGYWSSYIGMGEWKIEDGVLTLTENTGYDLVFRFSVKDGELVYIKEGSSEFMYVTVGDGDKFIYRKDTIPVYEIETGEEGNRLSDSHNNRDTVEQVGSLPEEFRAIVDENRFYEITAFSDRILVSYCIGFDYDEHTAEYRIEMMDLYGNVMASSYYKTDDVHIIKTLTATEDGGFLFVSVFNDIQYTDTTWASDSGVVSHVVKCDRKGTTQWIADLNDYSSAALNYCFEKDGNFYFFGDNEDPETKRRGVYSLTDIYLTVIRENGEIADTKRIRGGDYDNLNNVEMQDDEFVLSISSQSDDGDFAGSNSHLYSVDWVFVLDKDLNIVNKEIKKGREYFDKRLGFKDGAPVYSSDRLFEDFDAGSPGAFIDYEDFYLIVSEHRTGHYENQPPEINSTWYYTETVYSGYDKSGKLIFRASIDSSVDYDWLLSEYYS